MSEKTVKVEGSLKKWQGLKLPHVFVILVFLILLATLLTYLVPAGQFDRITDAATNRTMVDPASFHRVDNKPVSFLNVPKIIFTAIVSAAGTLFMVMISTACIDVLLSTGAFDIAMKKLIVKFKGKEIVLILIAIFLFTLMGLRQNSMTLVGYVPLMVLLCRLCGYDALCGAAIIIIGAGGSYSVGALSIAITAVAQDLAGLPAFSGLGYRLICTVVVVTLGTIYLIRYGKKVKADPKNSIVYELEKAEKSGAAAAAGVEMEKMTFRHWGVVIVFFISYITVAYGAIFLGWGNGDIAGHYLGLAVIGGLIGGLNLSEISKNFAKGAAKMTTACLMIGIAGAISSVMGQGRIIDTIVNSLVSALNVFPTLLQPTVMYVLNSIINVFITSGSGQAAVVMPLFVPTADIIGMTRQTCVLAFNFGDGFSNFLIPTSAALMGNIMAAGVTLPQWCRFFWKLFLIWSAAAAVLVTIAQLIGYGPF
jgi:uncharacterized ion transporter superfamily protein YfcC